MRLGVVVGIEMNSQDELPLATGAIDAPRPLPGWPGVVEAASVRWFAQGADTGQLTVPTQRQMAALRNLTDAWCRPAWADTERLK